MNYRTTCPHCASVFRLGTDQLDAAQGWVQCSVCGAAFDARPGLLLEDGSPLPPPEPVAATPAVAAPPEPVAAVPETATAAEQESHELAADVTAEAVAGEETPEPVASEGALTAADLPRGITQRDATLDLPSIILIDPEIVVSEDLGPVPQIYPAPSTYPPKPAAPVLSPAPTAATAAMRPKARIEYAAPMPDKARFALPRVQPWAWGTAAILLLVTLLAQTAYFLRDSLVSQWPQTRPVLEQACATLGCTLSLPKNLALLKIIGSDLQTEPNGRLTLSLTLGNRAAHAQAWPVLVLTLTDQRNRPLARRSFAPSEYLGDARLIAAGIPPRSEQALNLPLSVNNLAPMGFSLQMVY
jgi:predicted Zn finger-like uncharacterized protein